MKSDYWGYYFGQSGQFPILHVSQMDWAVSWFHDTHTTSTNPQAHTHTHITLQASPPPPNAHTRRHDAVTWRDQGNQRVMQHVPSLSLSLTPFSFPVFPSLSLVKSPKLGLTVRVFFSLSFKCSSELVRVIFSSLPQTRKFVAVTRYNGGGKGEDSKKAPGFSAFFQGTKNFR